VSRLILLISLVPIILSVVIRKLFCDRGVRSAGDAKTSRTGRELADILLSKAGIASQVEIEEKRRAEVKVGKSVRLILTKRLAESTNVLALGEVALLCGHALVATSNPDLLKWRQWAVKFSFAFPIFSVVVLVFAVVVAKIPAGLGLAFAAAALGFGSLFSLLSLQVEVQGARMMATIIDESRVFPRLRESEAVARACKSLAYKQAVPGAIEILMGRDMERKIAKEVGRRVAGKVLRR